MKSICFSAADVAIDLDAGYMGQLVSHAVNNSFEKEWAICEQCG